MVPFPDRPGLHFCLSLTVSMGSVSVWMVRLPSYRTGCRNKMTAEQSRLFLGKDFKSTGGKHS